MSIILRLFAARRPEPEPWQHPLLYLWVFSFCPPSSKRFLFFVPPGDDDDPSRTGFVGRSLEERRMYSLCRR